MRKFYLDFETRSGANLKEEGADRHLSHPWADVWCMAYAVGDDPVQVLPSAGLPSVLLTASLLIDIRFVAHNAQFEWQVWNKILVKKYGLPPIGIDRFDCTMARGYSMGLPGSLDNMSATLGLQQGKDMAGSRLAVQMASPRANKDGSVMIDGSGNPVWWDDPEKRERLYAYCKQDVEVERAIDRRVVPLTPNEHRVWCLDAAINQRGVCVDMPAIETALEIVEHEGSKDLNKLYLLTEGAVEGPTQVKRLTDWIQKQGVEIPGLNKQVVIDYLDDPEVPAAVAEVLRIRQDFAKTSTAKLNRMHGSASSNNRLRGLFAYGATGTGRFAGRIAQPQNLPRPTISQDEIETIIEFLKTHDAHESIAYLNVFHGKPMAMISNCLRGMLCAGPGLQLNAGDFANIEGRVLCWLAGEEWKLQAFRDYDAGVGTDIYLISAARIYQKPVTAFTKKSPERQIGKVAELACLGAETRVLTSRGVKVILDVTTEDKVWDGLAWVPHQGVIKRGVRQVVRVAGIDITPDHLVRTGQTWTPARLLVLSESTRSLALETASVNLPWLGFWGDRLLRCGVRAVRRPIAYTTIISAKDEARGVMRALRSKPGIIEKVFGGTQMWCRTTPIGGAFSTAFQPVLIGATIHGIEGTPTTVGAVYRCSPRGEKTDGRSCATWFHWRVGTSRLWSWIGKMLTGAMNQITCNLLREVPIKAIAEKCEFYSDISQNLKPVYDLACAGPRNRFTIITDEGPLIVHNCGYQGGVGAFQTMAPNYGVKIPDEQAEQIKVAWRALHPRIKQYWYELENAAIEAVEYPGSILTVGPESARVRFKKDGSFLWCLLPSGRALCYPYPELKQIMTPWGQEKYQLRYKTVDDQTKQWTFTDTYGGKLAENITQAVARDLLVEAMQRVDAAGLPIVLHVHDEIVTESSTNTLDELLRLMRIVPHWAAGLPIAVEGWSGFRYRK